MTLESQNGRRNRIRGVNPNSPPLVDDSGIAVVGFVAVNASKSTTFQSIAIPDDRRSELTKNIGKLSQIVR